ncbi:MAG: HD domain-containing protein [Candidatus Woesearchaeota archaeon]
MKELEELKHLIRLKEVERRGEVGDRRESTAEHTWACMILADHFIKMVKQPLDELKVMKIIMYHDLVEVECGDVFILDTEARKNKKVDEKNGSRILADKIPASISKDFLDFFEEFEACETPEAKFAMAMDKMEPIIHWSVYSTKKLKSLGWNEEVIRKTKEKYMEPFPELLKFFNDWIEHMKEEGYIE